MTWEHKELSSIVSIRSCVGGQVAELCDLQAGWDPVTPVSRDFDTFPSCQNRVLIGCLILLHKLESTFLKYEEAGRAPWRGFYLAARGGISRTRMLLFLGESSQGVDCASVPSFLVEATHATFLLIYNWSLGGK